MTGKTRYFLAASLLVLTVGLGAGLVAYYVGLPIGAISSQGSPDDLKFIPRTASIVGFADVHEIMLSDVHRQILALVPSRAAGLQEFQNQTGINPETDIDQVAVGVVPTQADQGAPVGAIALVRGRFNEARIEELMIGRGAQVENYNGSRLLVVENPPHQQASLSLAFIDSGLMAVGRTAVVRSAVDLKAGGDGVTADQELMSLLPSVETGNAWAFARLDAVTRDRLPAGFARQLPPLSWVSVSGRISDGIRGEIQAEAKNQEAADNLREVVRGFIALTRLQASSNPELADAIASLNLGGAGNTVSLSFNLPPKAIGLVGAVLPRRGPPLPEGR